MSRLARKLVAYLAATLAALEIGSGRVSAQPVPSTLHPKVEIALFRYRGATEDHDSGAKFDVFRGLIEQKIDNLRNQILQGAMSEEGGLRYIENVHLQFHGEDSFGTVSNVRRWLANEGNVLNAMRGTIVSDDGTNYIVYSRFHLAEASTDLSADIVTLSLPIKAEEFANTRDTHTLVILYALAMDAKRMGLSTDSIAVLLGAATNVIADLERRAAGLNPDLDRLEKAIEREAADLLGENSGP